MGAGAVILGHTLPILTAVPFREQTALTVKLDMKVHCTMGQDSCPSRGPLRITVHLQIQWGLLYPDKAGFTSCDKHKGNLGRRIRIPKEAQDRRQNEQRKRHLSGQEHWLLLQRSSLVSQQAQGSSQPPVTPVPGDLKPSSGLLQGARHGRVYIYIK